MPWRENCAMDERIGFINDHLSKLWTMTELCERYEISRKTGYKWLERYTLFGAAGLMERPRAPLVHGRTTPQHLIDAIVGLRRERPSWGARKIIGKLADRQPEVEWPAASTAGEILKRAGLVCARRLRRRGPPRLGELTVPQHANHVLGGGSQRLGTAWRWLARRTVDDDGWVQPLSDQPVGHW
jgi:DNA-binding transcriptional ArsR family regulator